MFCHNDQLKFPINVEEFQPLEEVFGSGPLSFCFHFKSDSSIDAVIKMPPTTQKVPFTSHKIDCVNENVLLIWIVQPVIKFIHAHRFGL